MTFPSRQQAWSFVTLGVMMLAAGCGSQQSSPTRPSPPASLSISCPADVSADTTSDSALVTYPAPVTTGGVPPTSTFCTAISGSPFPLGTTNVTCTATDATNRQASCTFRVSVLKPPIASGTRFLAFGDSMTAGEVTATSALFDLHPELSYPTLLQEALTARYRAQAIVVVNCGVENQRAVDDVSRLQSVLAGGECGSPIPERLRPRDVSGPYDALLLLEGTNDINTSDPMAIPLVVEALRTDIGLARDAGVAQVFLATLPPERVDGFALVPAMNDEIRSLAASENVVLVDIYEALGGASSTLIGPDGIHPTASGYQVMADTFFAAIVASFEDSMAMPLRRPGRR